MRKLQLRFEILIMEIARDLSVVPARPGSKSSGLCSEIPAFSAGAGTWVCGNRKTNQMLPALGLGCKWIPKGRRMLKTGSNWESGDRVN